MFDPDRARESNLANSFEVSPVKSVDPTQRVSTFFEKRHTSTLGPGLGASLVLLGKLKSETEFDNSAGGGLSLLEAFSVLFCCAFGAGIAFQGWYPKLVGFYGYPLVLLIVGLSASVAGNALFEVARFSKATSFAELSLRLPAWTRKVTPWCMIAWNFTIISLYVQFVFTFINNQILERWDLQVEPMGLPALPLYSSVGATVFVLCLPTSFGGTAMKLITNTNFTTTWIVIFTAITKGIHTVVTSSPENRPPPEEYNYWRPEGFLQVMVLVGGAMFQVVLVPRLNFELQEPLREKAAVLLPFGLAFVQASIFCLIGTVGYLALGNAIPDNGDVFAAYYQIRPDWMTTVLQGGIALLMFLSIPLFSLTGKSELWGMISQLDADGNPVLFEDASLPSRFLLNLGMTLLVTLVPCAVGRDMFMNIWTIANGTVATWMNLFLPSLVIMWVKVIPSKRNGEPWVGLALRSVWILIMGCAGVYTSAAKLIDVFSE